MPLRAIRQNSFVGGEIAPGLSSAFDLEKVQLSVQRMENAVPVVHGGVENRGGTQFIQQFKYNDRKVRLIPFTFSVAQSYVLEFGDEYIRIHSGEGGTLADRLTATITAVTNSDPAVVTVSEAGIIDGDWVYFTGVTGMPEINNRFFIVYNSLGNVFQITDLFGEPIDSSGFGVYVSGGDIDRVYEVDTTVVSAFPEEVLFELSYAQDGDVLYIAHNQYALRTLTRKGAQDWELELASFEPEVVPPNTLAITGIGIEPAFELKITTVSIDGEESEALLYTYGSPPTVFTLFTIKKNTTEVTWEYEPTATNVSHFNIYLRATGYRDFGYYDRRTWAEYDTGVGSFKYTFALDGIDIVVNYGEPLLSIESYIDFTLPDNYPGVVAFFDQRLILAASINHPLTFWGSVIGLYNRFIYHEPIRASDAYEFRIASARLDAIKWIIGFQNLLVGTADSEWRVSSGSAVSSTITQESVEIRRQSSWGVSKLFPLRTGETLLCVDSSGTTIRELNYATYYEMFTSVDLSIMATHLFRGLGVIDWAYQQLPGSVVWACRSDGVLLGMTYLKEHKIFGWHQHSTDGSFEGTCGIPQEVNGFRQDGLYVAVKRFVRGQQVRYLEKFRPRLPVDAIDEKNIKDAYFVDSGLTYYEPIAISEIQPTTPVTVITAVEHGLVTGDLVDLGRISRGAPLNEKRFYAEVVDTTSFELYTEEGHVPIDGSDLDALITGGEVRKVIYQVIGLYHLEGREVSILADGSVQQKTVENARIQFDEGVSIVHVGLPYTTEIQTLDYDFTTNNGYLQERPRSMPSVVVELQDSRQLFIGPNVDRLSEIAFRSTEVYGQPIRLFTGEKEVALAQGDPRKSSLFIRGEAPVPFTVLSLMPRINYSE